MHFDETLEFIKYIKDKIDILHVSAGLHDLWGEVYYMRWLLSNYTMDRAYNVQYAKAIKERYPELTVAVVGAIKDPAMAEEIIASGCADIVAMNRALHADFEMPRKYAQGREWEHMPCLRCGNCFRMASPHTAKLCSVNPIWGRYKEYPEARLPKAPVKKKVAVVGGGPAGVEAAKWLLQRGHDVTIYEKEAHLGGHVRDAVAAEFKRDLRDYIGYMEAFGEHCGAKVLLNTTATPEMLNAENYDAVFAAVGADPIFPKVEGIDLPNVHWAPDAENGKVPCGDNVVIVGGASVGTEASVSLSAHGKKVTVIEMVKDVPALHNSAGGDLIRLGEENGVVRMMGTALRKITPTCVVAENVDTGEVFEIPADTVLMAVGMKPRRAEAMKFAQVCNATEFFIIGDAYASGDVRDATFHAFEAARYI